MGWLDAIRGVAALLVAVHHFGLLALIPGGAYFGKHFDLGIYAVMVFFLVSGYIIPASLERRGDVRGFWVGRFFRIYPLLLVVVTIALLVLPQKFSAVPVQGDIEQPVRATVANLTLLQDLLNIPNGLGVLWTLSYEMVFYFFVSALFVAGWHRKSSEISIGFGALCLLLGAAVPSQMITHDKGSTLHAVMSAALIMGMGLVCIMTGRPAATKFGAVLLGGLGAVLIFGNSRAMFFESMIILGTMFAGTAIYRAEKGQADKVLTWLGCGFVIVAGFAAGYMYNRGIPAIWKSWVETWQGFSFPYLAAWITFGLAMLARHKRFPRVLTFLGAISYSVYVVHIPVLMAVRWLVPATDFPAHGIGKFSQAGIFLAAVIGISYLTYRFVELPGQNLGRRLLKRMQQRSEPVEAKV